MHALSLADRFKRSTARAQQRRDSGTPTSAPPTSAFAAHYRCEHSQPEEDAVPSCCSPNDAAAANDNNNKARRSRRISPPTNVITASLLPQISCVSGLCRGCAEVARGLRERLAELEAPLAAGSARSKQRRAYATLLRVAPVLLRFLASAVAAVELFVIEWDRRTTPPSSADEQQAAGQAVAGAGPAEQEQDAAVEAAAAAAGLAFLRRLAAVNGTLCVTAPGEFSKKVVAGPGGGRIAGKDSSSSSGKGATCKKKGFAQALAELASFLETKTA